MLPLPSSSGPRPPHPLQYLHPQYPHPHHPPASHPPPPRDRTASASHSSRVVSPDTVTPPPSSSWRLFGPHEDFFHGRPRRWDGRVPPRQSVVPSAPQEQEQQQVEGDEAHSREPPRPRRRWQCESYDPPRMERYYGVGFHDEEEEYVTRWERGWHPRRRRESYATAWRGDGRGSGDSNGGVDLGHGRDHDRDRDRDKGSGQDKGSPTGDHGDRLHSVPREDRPDDNQRASGFAFAVDNIIAAAKAIDQRERVPSHSASEPSAAGSTSASDPAASKSSTDTLENTEERPSVPVPMTKEERGVVNGDHIFNGNNISKGNVQPEMEPSPPIITSSVRSIHHAQPQATPSDERRFTGHPHGYRSPAHPPPPYYVPPPRHHPGHGHYHPPPPPPHHPYYAYPRRYAHPHAHAHPRAHARIPPPPHASPPSPRHRPPTHTGGAPPHRAYDYAYDYDYYPPDLRREHPPPPRRPSSPPPRPWHDPRYGPAPPTEPRPYPSGEWRRSASPPTGKRPFPATDDDDRTQAKCPRASPSRTSSSSRPADATPPVERERETPPSASSSRPNTLPSSATSRPTLERNQPTVQPKLLSPGTLQTEIDRAVLAARRIESDPSLYRAILLRMALERESKDSPKKPMMMAEAQTTEKKSRVIYEGFFWKDYPPLENILRRFMEEYYEMSENRPQSKKQQQFNNRLVSIVHHTATTHGWTFDPETYGKSETNIHSPNGDFNYKKLRDRIRCYYKTHVQNSKKRLITLLKHPKKAKNREMLLRLVREVGGDEDGPMGRSEEFEIPSSAASARVAVVAVTPSDASFAPNVKDVPAKVLFPSSTSSSSSSSFRSTPLPGEVGSSPSSSIGESTTSATILAQVSPPTTTIEHSAVLNPMQEEAV